LIGLFGVAMYAAGTFIAPFSSRSDLRYQLPGSAYSTFITNVRDGPAKTGFALMLYGGAAVALAMCVGGLASHRPRRWAAGLGAAAAAWATHATGWMNNVNIDFAGQYRVLGHSAAYYVSTLGSLIALAGGVLAFVANRTPGASHAPGAQEVTGSPGRRLLIGVGLCIGLAAGVVYVIGTFLPYGGPSRVFVAPIRYSAAQVSAGLGRPYAEPVANQIAAGLALWGTAVVVMAVCVVGLVRRAPAAWAMGLAAAATAWVLRTIGESILGYINSPLTYPHIGYHAMQLGVAMAFAGGLVALAGGLVRRRPAPAG
jgi:hypothetical protein